MRPFCGVGPELALFPEVSVRRHRTIASVPTRVLLMMAIAGALLFLLGAVFVEAMCRSLAATSIRADCPSGKFPTTLVLLRISRLIRSNGLFVLNNRQCSRGKT